MRNEESLKERAIAACARDKVPQDWATGRAGLQCHVLHCRLRYCQALGAACRRCNICQIHAQVVEQEVQQPWATDGRAGSEQGNWPFLEAESLTGRCGASCMYFAPFWIF